MANFFIRAISVAIGLCLGAWVAVCIRRGKLPTATGFRKDYFHRRHDALGFWVFSCFYLALGAAIILAGLLQR